MNGQLIWSKIKELAISFYNFIMAEGEINLLMVSEEFWVGDNASGQSATVFLLMLVLMAVIVVFASDSVRFLHPIQEIKEWGGKISFVKVVIFSATVFSIHTFYKMLVILLARLFHAEASILALECLGSYINPLSIMIYAFVVSTMHLKRGQIQAFFIGLSIFLIPAIMSYYLFTMEHVVLYVAGIVLGVTGRLLLLSVSPLVTCFIMYIVYFGTKYLMIYFSEQVMLLNGNTIMEKIGKYLACVEIDLIIAVILLFVLFSYHIAVKENKKVIKELFYPITFAIVLVVSIVCSQKITVVAEEAVKTEPIFEMFQNDEENGDAETSEKEEEKTIFKVIVDKANIRSGPGTEYDVLTTTTGGTIFCGTGNEQVHSSGSVWYEIYLDEECIQTGWASEKVIAREE